VLLLVRRLHVSTRAGRSGAASTDPDSLGRSDATTCGGQTSTGLTTPTGLGGPDPHPPGRGLAPPRAATEAAAGPVLPRARGRRPFAGHQPNYRIKCGRWAVRAQVKVWSAQLTPRKPACFQNGASLCSSRRQTACSHITAPRVGDDGLLQVSRGARCNSVRGGDGAAGQRCSFACQRVLTQQWQHGFHCWVTLTVVTVPARQHTAISWL
jgi:hypothetical protein